MSESSGCLAYTQIAGMFGIRDFYLGLSNGTLGQVIEVSVEEGWLFQKRGASNAKHSPNLCILADESEIPVPAWQSI